MSAVGCNRLAEESVCWRSRDGTRSTSCYAYLGSASLANLYRTSAKVDLAEKLNLAPPTVNKILGGLLEADFVRRAKYEDDARSTRIFLTERGKDVKEALEEKWADLEMQTVEGMTQTEALILKQLLQKMLGADL